MSLKLTTFSEPASYLHQFSRTIVEAKRHGQTYQAVVNGSASKSEENGLKPMRTNFWQQQHQRTEKLSPFAKGLQSPTVNRHTVPIVKQESESIVAQTAKQLSVPEKQTFPNSTIRQQQTVRPVNPPLSVPVPQRAQKSPILTFNSALPKNEGWTAIVPSKGPQPSAISSLPEPHPIFTASSIPPSTVSYGSVQSEVTMQDDSSPSPRVVTEEKHPAPSTVALRHPSLFDRQEKLLHEELRLREAERQSKLDLADQERKTAIELSRRQALEREQTRQKESVFLKAQQIAAQEQERNDHAAHERRKVQEEQNIQIYTEEIVDTLVQEHVFETIASVLAEEFHRRFLLHKSVHNIKVVSARSLRRKQLLLEKMAQSRKRKELVSRALTELDSGRIKTSVSNMNGRRVNRRYSIEDEEAFEKILLNVCGS